VQKIAQRIRVSKATKISRISNKIKQN